MTKDLIEKVARENFASFASRIESKAEWTSLVPQHKKHWLTSTERALQAIDAAGYVILLKGPTAKILDILACVHSDGVHGFQSDLEDAYKDIIKAAQQDNTND